MSADAREHNTNSLDCWCQPEYFVACHACGPDIKTAIHMTGITTERVLPCIACAGGKHKGLIAVDRVAAALRGADLIVHRDACDLA